MPVIASPHNERVMAARRLHERRYRAAERATLVEGPHAVEVALACGTRLREVFVTEAFAAAEPTLLTAAADAGGELRMVTGPVLARLAETRTPQGLVAVADVPEHSLDTVLAAAPRLVALLVECADPGNLGTAARTADAAGADALLLTPGSADPWSGKAIRASAGSMFSLPAVDRCDPVVTMSALREAGLIVLVTAADGEADLDALIDACALDEPTTWVFGNEARGLPGAVAAAADHRVRIPMAGRAESLNLAASVAVCLYASARAHRRP